MYTKITKREARQKNLKKYFTGYVCKNGHVEQRYTNTGVCVGCKVKYDRPQNHSQIKEGIAINYWIPKKYKKIIQEFIGGIWLAYELENK